MNLNEKIIVPFFFLSLTMFSCKKEKLDGDKARLIGTWEWEYSYSYKQVSPYQTIFTDTIFAAGHPDQYRIKFEEEGIMEWHKNGKKVKKEYLVFNYVDCSNTQNLTVLYCQYVMNGDKYKFTLSPFYPRISQYSSGTEGKMFPNFNSAPDFWHFNHYKKIE